MKTKQQLQAKVVKLQARIDAMPDEVAKNGVIYDMPEEGTEVWYLDYDGQTYTINFSHEHHGKELEQGIFFHDEESAINAGKVRVIRHRLAGFCAKAWEDSGKVIDWNNWNQQKYQLGYDYAYLEPITIYRCSTKLGVLHLPSSDLTKLKEEFTDDELKLALTGEV